ncbi:Sister chromatid cohesion protein 2 [Modicella reniformis]|uniref:Sister chromatid cohesion protein n=1 Tax=Modicella reniformis TaxID=1440133 RepID=A0A9P6MAH6_9FUNG|nr:Sister chromatid cohesion protein 2 [Modicella reniformis]
MLTRNHIPTDASSGLQYSALASLTSVDSAFPEFRLMQPQDASAKTILDQNGLSEHALSFQRQYLSTVVFNADVENICFQSASQITAIKESFSPHFEYPLSLLAESILDHCTNSNEKFDAGQVYQLPRIDAYDTLNQLRKMAAVSYENVSYEHLPLEVPNREELERNVHTSMLSSRKRAAQDRQDIEEDRSLCIERSHKRIKPKSDLEFIEIDLDRFTGVSHSITPSSQATQDVRISSDSALAGPLNVLSLEENDPTAYFEDLVVQYMERITNVAPGSGDHIIHLTSSELRQLGLIFESLSKKGILADVQVDTLSELLKYLDTSMSDFVRTGLLSSDDDEFTQDEQAMREKASLDLDYTVMALEHVRLSIIVFNGEDLQQHLFPEELLIASLTVFKSQLETFLAPALQFPEANSGLFMSSRIFKVVVADEPLKAKLLSLIRITGEICNKLSRSDRTDLSDSAIVKLVYTGLSLFFIDTSEMALGPTEAESLKRAGSSVLRMVYAKYADQRTTILEEILSSLIKLPHGKKIFKGFRSIDGLKLHSFSALLMQLVQASAVNPLPDVAPTDFQNLHRSAQMIEMQKVTLPVSFVALFSLKQSYDLKAKCLDDGNSESTSKTMAVDSLGLIAAKVKTILHQLTIETTANHDSGTETELWQFFGELNADTKLNNLVHLQARYNSVVECLSFVEASDSAARAAKNSWICQWITTICTVATKSLQGLEWRNDNWELLTSECLRYWKLYNSLERRHKSKAQMIGKEVSLSATYLTARQQLFASFDMFLSRILGTLEAGAVTLRAKSLKALSFIVTGDCTVLAQHNVRKTIALRLQDPSPSVRDAATELVGRYMLQDATIRKCYYDIVSDRISDTGLNVRKRVMRLLRDMYFKTDEPAMRSDIAQRLLLRVHDEETTVKDLAIKSVTEVWFTPFLQATSRPKESHEKAYESTSGPVSSSQKREVSKHARLLVDVVSKLSIPQEEAFTSVIQHMIKPDRGHHSLLSTTAKDCTRSFSAIVDCLVDLVQTLQEEDAPKLEIAAALHTLCTFVKSEPQLIEAKHLSALVVYFHCATTPEDWRITMFVLRVYQNATHAIRDVPLSDVQTAERLLLALVAKCPTILLPEAVSVLCLIAKARTVHSERLCKFFQTCMDLLIGDAEKFRSAANVQENKMRRLMTIVGLICMHFPFEQINKDNPRQAHLEKIKAKMAPTIQDYVFDTLASLCEGNYARSLKQAALQSLGFLFMPFPSLLNTSRSIHIMDSIFEDQDIGLKTELLQIYVSFLVRLQSAPVSTQEDDVKHSLIAEAEDHLEMAIGSAVMQRYLDRVLRCALVHDRGIQTVAVDVISQVTLQALVHPVLCMPVIVALEASDDPSLGDRAFKIHQDLHQKYSSLIYSKSMECIRVMYNYQQDIHRGHSDIQGYKVIPETGNAAALLNPFYSLVGDKRQARNALLLALVKVLDPDLTASEAEIDGNYCRFIAENIAYLEYRTMEEIYLNLATTTSDPLYTSNFNASREPDALVQHGSTNGTYKKSTVVKGTKNGRGRVQAVDAVECDFHGDIEGVSRNLDVITHQIRPCGGKEDMESGFSLSVLARLSIVVEAAVLLKSHLKRMYDISEAKSQQFHPTTHASHKEKCAPRLTGLLARIQWRWSAQEVNAICGKTHTRRDDKIWKDLIKRQIEQFRALIEAEAIQRSQIEDAEGHRQGHLLGTKRGHARKDELPREESEGEE